MAETASELLTRLRREVSELTGPQQISPIIAGASRVTEATRTALVGVDRRTEVVRAPTRHTLGWRWQSPWVSAGRWVWREVCEAVQLGHATEAGGQLAIELVVPALRRSPVAGRRRPREGR
jgi:hypothetical protein